ncbi:arginase family protein [[Clostridium] innocuum]|nr:hypothetical protein HMPREF0983_02355 [Erysipelotrichaceae bacterium 3_1_53]MCR0205317.1 arginase family protein [[Clostridium] innocuum]RJV89082.1 arginase family protein [Erysipelotrichaceae bacterium AF19-24AC]RJV91489.1 arginase family protein [Erysipelotrichaceae bacterium AF15-26LB]MCR0265096.1 arginase family protein [[Clostridium] innocuum]
MKTETLRIIYPQWEGGNRFVYAFGAKILSYLSPDSEDETLELPLVEEYPTMIEDGIAYKSSILKQANELLNTLKTKKPGKLVVFGGDCSISLAPFTYLLDKYGTKNTAILWIDRHGDISVTGETTDYHAMVLSSFLGEGDVDFREFVTQKIDISHVLHIGVNDTEKEFSRSLGQKYDFNNVPPEAFANNSDAVLNKLRSMNVANILIHLDIDVLDLSSFRSQSSANPDVYFDRLKIIKPGAAFEAITRLLQDIDHLYNIVGLSIAEYLPWDLMNLSKMLSELPLLRKK